MIVFFAFCLSFDVSIFYFFLRPANDLLVLPFRIEIYDISYSLRHYNVIYIAQMHNKITFKILEIT